VHRAEGAKPKRGEPLTLAALRGLRCELATCLGWTFEETDKVTLWHVDDLYRHWRQNPPPAMLLRAFLMDPKKKPKRPSKEAFADPFAD
jgi:hypothetical protein